MLKFHHRILRKINLSNKLECGNNEVANRKTNLDVVEWPPYITFNARNSVVAFFDTTESKSPMLEAKDELGISNNGEANLVAQLGNFCSYKKSKFINSNF